MRNYFYLKVTFLGTGTSQGIPIIGSTHPVCLSDDFRDKRFRVSILVEWDDYGYVVDCGPDFRQQMLAASVQNIDGIIFTHEHSDHVAGLDDIRPFVFRQGDLPIYANNRVMTALKRRFDYVFSKENRYPGAPAVQENIITKEPFQLQNMTIVPVLVKHANLDIFGYRFDKFAYLTDVKTIEEEEKKKLQNLDVLVVNALRIEEHPSHFNLEEALAFIKETQPKRAYLTHISNLLGFHAEVEKELPKNVFLAYDNLTISINEE